MSPALVSSRTHTAVFVTGWKLGARLRPQALLCTDPAADSEEEVNPGGSTPKAAPDECRTDGISQHSGLLMILGTETESVPWHKHSQVSFVEEHRAVSCSMNAMRAKEQELQLIRQPARARLHCTWSTNAHSRAWT